MSSKLDETRDFGILGCGDKKFYEQDGKTFDPTTKEEIDLSTLPKEKPKPKPEAPSVLVCKFCGAKRETPELMKEHLLALHREDIEKDKAEKAAAEAEQQKTEEPKKQCPHCKAPKNPEATKGEWQFSCDCYKLEEKEKPEEPSLEKLAKEVDEMKKSAEDEKIVPVTAADVLHKKGTEDKSDQEKK